MDKLLEPEDEAPEQKGERFVFRHNTISSFKVGPFEFGNHILTIDENTPASGQVAFETGGKLESIRGMSVGQKRDAFLCLAQQLKRIDQVNIEELNPAILDNMRQPLSKAIRGTMQTGQTANKALQPGGPGSTLEQDGGGELSAEEQEKLRVEEEKKKQAGGSSISSLIAKNS